MQDSRYYSYFEELVLGYPNPRRGSKPASGLLDREVQVRGGGGGSKSAVTPAGFEPTISGTDHRTLSAELQGQMGAGCGKLRW